MYTLNYILTGLKIITPSNNAEVINLRIVFKLD